MKKENSHKKYLNLVLSIALAAVYLCFAGADACFAQDREGLTRYVETGKTFSAPVRVLTVTSDSGNIPLNQPFLARNDWLKHFTISFINDDIRPITHFSLSIHFPKFEKQQSKIGFAYPMEYGESPYADQDGEFLVNTAKPVAKGEKIILALSDEDYDRIIEGLGAADFPSEMYKVQLQISTIGYNDDTVWRAGKFYTIDRNSGRLIPPKKTPLTCWKVSSLSPRFSISFPPKMKPQVSAETTLLRGAGRNAAR
jgi:hypothetical protein